MSDNSTADEEDLFDGKPQKEEESLWDTVKTILYAVLFALVVRSFAYEPFSIPSGSMIPTLLVGDYLFSRSFQLMVETGSLPVLDILANAAATIAEGGATRAFNFNQMLPIDDPDYCVCDLAGLGKRGNARYRHEPVTHASGHHRYCNAETVYAELWFQLHPGGGCDLVDNQPRSKRPVRHDQRQFRHLFDCNCLSLR